MLPVESEIFEMKNKKSIAEKAASEIIKKLWSSKEKPNISGLKITPEFHLWIAKNLYSEAKIQNDSAQSRPVSVSQSQ